MTREFRTGRLSFAAWLHASAQLEFLGAQYNRDMDKVEFCFVDPNRIGRDLEDDFDRGPATVFHSMHYLRKLMTAA